MRWFVRCRVRRGRIFLPFVGVRREMKGCGSLRGGVRVLDFEEIGLDERQRTWSQEEPSPSTRSTIDQLKCRIPLSCIA